MGSFLRIHFPDVQVSTSGLNANPALPIPFGIMNLLHAWKMLNPNEELVSKKFEYTSIDQETILIASDSKIYSNIVGLLPNFRIIDLEEFAKRFGLSIRDPISLSPEYFELEISKHLFLINRLMLELFPKSIEQTSSFLGLEFSNPIKSDHLNSYIEEFKKNVSLQMVVDVTFIHYFSKVLNEIEWTSSYAISKDDANFSFPSISEETSFLQLRTETHHLESVWISKWYADFFRELQSFSSVIILLPPKFEVGRAQVHFYLAALHCHRIEPFA